MQSEVVVENDLYGYGRLGRDIAVSLGLLDHDAWGFIAESSDLVSDFIAIAESLGVLQVEPERECALDRQRRPETCPGFVERKLAGERSLAEPEVGLSEALIGLGNDLESRPVQRADLGEAGRQGLHGEAGVRRSDEPDRQCLERWRRHDP